MSVCRRVATFNTVAFRLAGSRSYLERNGIPKRPEDLDRHDFVTAGGLESLSLESGHGTVEIPLRVALRCRTMTDVAMTVAGGMGLALLPTTLLSDPAFANVLRPVLPDLRLKEFNLYLLYCDRKFLPFKARAFIDLVLESGRGKLVPAQNALGANRSRCMPEERLQALAV